MATGETTSLSSATHHQYHHLSLLETIAEMSIEEREELLTLQPGAEPVDNDDGDEVFVSPKGPPSVDDSLSSSSSGVLATLKIADGADPVTRRIILESQKDGSKRILLSDLEENISIIFHRFLQPGNNNNNSKAALKITSIDNNGRLSVLDSDAKVEQEAGNISRLDVEVCNFEAPPEPTKSDDGDAMERLCDICGDDLTGSDSDYGLGHFKCLHCYEVRICCGCEAVGRHEPAQEGGHCHLLVSSALFRRAKSEKDEDQMSQKVPESLEP